MSFSAPSLRREPYFDTSDDAVEAAHARRLLTLLVAQDGSATRLCEALAGGPVTLKLLHQSPTENVPRAVRELLPGTRFIERITRLSTRGQVMMDNLSYIALEGIDRSLREELEAMEARGALPPKLRDLKDELARIRLADAQSRAPADSVARAPAEPVSRTQTTKDKAA